MGWLKVAESIINPFGDDDDDFEVEAIIRHNKEIAEQIISNSNIVPCLTYIDLPPAPPPTKPKLPPATYALNMPEKMNELREALLH
ncbi:unnamed protein product [Soboliphyme baturini]|uniref:Bestrophin homolog n=1 Tax=Soboliphyme baturini TaxID=241478 RepID=A0A183J0J3_9BILA|nr:unnamed protein product [Soboliphyme baturini]